MCCFSHEQVNEGDIYEHGQGYVTSLMARDERLRCQCKYGDKCNRQMTQEDMLCDYCRDCRHSTECQDEHGLPRVEAPPNFHVDVNLEMPAEAEPDYSFKRDPRYRVN
jgi:hypothetical protein